MRLFLCGLAVCAAALAAGDVTEAGNHFPKPPPFPVAPSGWTEVVPAVIRVADVSVVIGKAAVQASACGKACTCGCTDGGPCRCGVAAKALQDAPAVPSAAVPQSVQTLYQPLRAFRGVRGASCADGSCR